MKFTSSIELPPLSDKISIEEVNFVLEKDKAAQYGIERVPALALLTRDASGETRDTRMRFLGTPAGYEFVSLVQALMLAGGHDSQLTPANRARIAAVTTATTIQVFSTPT